MNHGCFKDADKGPTSFQFNCSRACGSRCVEFLSEDKFQFLCSQMFPDFRLSERPWWRQWLNQNKSEWVVCDVYSTGHFLSYVCVCGWSEDWGLRSGAVSRQTLFNKCLFALATTMCQVVWVFLNIVSTWPGVIIRIKLQSHPDKSTITHSRSHLSHTHTPNTHSYITQLWQHIHAKSDILTHKKRPRSSSIFLWLFFSCTRKSFRHIHTCMYPCMHIHTCFWYECCCYCYVCVRVWVWIWIHMQGTPRVWVYEWPTQYFAFFFPVFCFAIKQPLPHPPFLHSDEWNFHPKCVKIGFPRRSRADWR